MPQICFSHSFISSVGCPVKAYRPNDSMQAVSNILRRISDEICLTLLQINSKVPCQAPILYVGSHSVSWAAACMTLCQSNDSFICRNRRTQHFKDKNERHCHADSRKIGLYVYCLWHPFTREEHSIYDAKYIFPNSVITTQWLIRSYSFEKAGRWMNTCLTIFTTKRNYYKVNKSRMLTTYPKEHRVKTTNQAKLPISWCTVVETLWLQLGHVTWIDTFPKIDG